MEKISRHDSIQTVAWLLFTVRVQVDSERAVRWENIETGEEKIAATAQVTTVIVEEISTVEEKRYTVVGTLGCQQAPK